MSSSTRDRVRGLFRRKKAPGDAAEAWSGIQESSSPVLNSRVFLESVPEGRWGNAASNSSFLRRNPSLDYFDPSSGEYLGNSEGQDLALNSFKSDDPNNLTPTGQTEWSSPSGVPAPALPTRSAPPSLPRWSRGWSASKDFVDVDFKPNEKVADQSPQDEPLPPLPPRPTLVHSVPLGRPSSNTPPVRLDVPVSHRRTPSQESNRFSNRQNGDDSTRAELSPPRPPRQPGLYESNLNAWGVGSRHVEPSRALSNSQIYVDPSVDPELALALKLSMEEEKSRLAVSSPFLSPAVSEESLMSIPGPSTGIDAPRNSGNFESGVDINEDPDLALAMKLSMEEEKARIAASSSAPSTTLFQSTPWSTLEQALKLRPEESNARAKQSKRRDLPNVKRKPVPKSQKRDDPDSDPELALALAMSLKEELRPPKKWPSPNVANMHEFTQPLATSEQFRLTVDPPLSDLADIRNLASDGKFKLTVDPPAEPEEYLPIAHPLLPTKFSGNVWDQYIYQPLLEDDIRLLVMHPRHSHDVMLQCDIIHVSLRGQKVPHYEALSYCWGKPGVASEILVGGKYMPVGENLWVALRNLQLSTGSQDRLLWVDALCINQEDTEERSIQVLRMGSIYQHAKRTVISLGGASRDEGSLPQWDESITLQEHADIHMGCAIQAIRSGTTGIIDVGSHYFPCMNFEDLPEWSSPCFGTSLSFLLASPWFRRRWVIQELAFSKEAIVQWGSYQVPWESLVDFVTWIEEYKDQIDFGKVVDDTGLMTLRGNNNKGLRLRQEGQGAGITIKKIEGLVFASKRMVQRGRHGTELERVYGLYPLDALVTRFAAFNVTDPRDIVYSLLAFARDRENCHPDYEKSVEEVFVEFFQYTVRKTSRLDIISFPWARMIGTTLPTWIKPWLGGPTRPLFAEFVEPIFEESLLQIDTMHMYSASGSTVAREVEFLRSNGRFVLRTEGIWVASVGQRSRSMSPDVTVHYTEQFKEWYGAAVNWHMSKRRTRSVMSKSRPGHSNKTQNSKGRMLSSPPNASRQLGTLRESFFKVVVAGKYSAEHTPYTDRTLFKAGLKQSYLGIMACSPLFQRIRPACYDRRLIWTDTGKLGLVPRKTESDDMICVLFGCSVPIILRPKDGRYVVVGECYVDGIMNGEAVLEYEMGKFSKMVFDIQ